jgi:hypothetical protein
MVVVSHSRNERSKRSCGCNIANSLHCLLLTFINVALLLLILDKGHYNSQFSFFKPKLLPFEPSQGPCAPRKGLVIVSMLDALEHNLFQIAIGRRLADELCWDLIFRPHWNVGLGPNEQECFPRIWNSQSFLNETYLHLPENITSALKFQPVPWSYMSPEWTQANQLLQAWANNLSTAKESWTCLHSYCGLSENSVQSYLSAIRSEDSLVNTVFLEGYHSVPDLFQNWRLALRYWLEIKPSCCSREPPSTDTVMIHVHHNETSYLDRRMSYLDIRGEEYRRWLQQYNLDGQPLWLVCEPGCEKTNPVKVLLGYYPQAQVVNPRDRIDMVCILSKAKTLLVTSNDILSSVAGFMTQLDSKIHYPTAVPGKSSSLFRMASPDWIYHEVDNGVFVDWNVIY